MTVHHFDIELHESKKLSQICEAAYEVGQEIIKNNPGLHPENELSVVIAQLKESSTRITFGHARGETVYYPASVVKLFFLVYAACQIQSKAIVLTPELKRAITDMIVDSNNDATSLVVDQITDAVGGPELSTAEFPIWIKKRQAITDFFKARGFANVETSLKTWNEGPYGREHQARGQDQEFRNQMTAIDGVQLMSLIALNKITEACELNDWILNLLQRKIGNIKDSQAIDYIGGSFLTKSFMNSSKGSPAHLDVKRLELYSKAGWTDEVRHDVAWIKGLKENDAGLVIGIFSKGVSDIQNLIPEVAASIMGQYLSTTRNSD